MDIHFLTNEQLAGQRIMVGFNGLALNDDLRFLIDTRKVGGIILFKQNIQSPDQVADLCHDANAYAALCGQPPLFVAIDQEGGTVARLPLPFTQFPGNSAMASEEEAIDFAMITAKELTEIGVNMNFAPVMDIAPRTMESVMAKRSFGDDPAWVAALGTAVIKHLQVNHVMAVAKHFPGIGRTTLDSHLDRPFFSITREDLAAFELIPFQAAIDRGVSGMMLSHIVYDRIDPDWPASLSVEIARHLLRNTLGYEGLVMTDDLDMGAIRKYYTMEAVVHQIIPARIDLMLICHQSPDIQNAHDLLLRHLDEKGCDEDFTAAINRIAAAKNKYLKP